MKISRLIGKSLLITALSFASVSYAGTLITDSGQMPGVDGIVDFADKPFQFTAGPEQVGAAIGEDIIFTSSSPFSGFSSGLYGLVENGIWGQGFTYAFINFGSGSYVRFAFKDGPVSAVGGFVNYAVCGDDIGCGSGPFSIRTYDSQMNLLDQFTVSNDAPISTPGALNDGAFRGIVRNSADIAVFEIEGGAGVIDDLTFFRDGDPVDPVDPCDINSDGVIDALDLIHFVRGCRANILPNCDLNDSGDFDLRDLVTFARTCGGNARIPSDIMNEIMKYKSVGTNP